MTWPGAEYSQDPSAKGCPHPSRSPTTPSWSRAAPSTTTLAHDEWRNASPELKSLENALDVRRRILSAFEAAENERDRARRAAWLRFVIVGAGPTGVEMAGQIAEIAHDTRRDFRAATSDMPRILLVEAADRVLGAFPPHLSTKATAALAGLGVDVLTGHTVTDITNDTVAITNPEGVTTGIPTRTTIWAAGVRASGLAAELAHASGVQTDRDGRITVDPNLCLANHPDVFAIGDMITIRHGSGTTVLPGLAPVAMQQGRYVARVLRSRRRGRPSRPFRYRPKGDLATIGRRRAVATLRGVRLSGTIAWAIWLAVHLFYLLGLQNRLIVLVRWSFSFLTHGRSSRLITHVDAVPPAPLPTHRLRAPHERPSSFE